jgi:hypothetical protein
MDVERNMYENQPIRKIARQNVSYSRLNQSKRTL